MAAEAAISLWNAATDLLDANFHFRSTDRANHLRRSYRTDANAPSLDVWLTDDMLLIESPVAVPELAAHLAPSEPESTGRLRYRIERIADLASAVSHMTGAPPAPGEQAPDAVADESSTDNIMNTPTNTILYGPPGTGKTYRTAEIAVAICDGKVDSDRQALMSRYEELRSEGRISFVTFHQSYGYEDFVEGLRPEAAKDGSVSYEIRPGLFRKVADAAKRNTVVQTGLRGAPLAERKIYKMSLGAAGSVKGNAIFQACIEKGYVLLGWGEDIDFTDCETESDIRKRVQDERPHDERVASHTRFVNAFKNEVKSGDIIIVSKGNSAFRAIGEVTGEYEYLEAPIAGQNQMRNVRWLAVFEKEHNVNEIYDRSFTMQTLYRLNSSFLKAGALSELLKAQQQAVNLPFVLVIDEINRANISKVFGELITLLEPDKREGASNPLTVKLPYSGLDFSVPSNLHVIGTMNTADRSIALLDTALRRRFEFEELQPDCLKLKAIDVSGVNLGEMLAALNERVEFLYDRDHTIGHAYLLGVHDLPGLDRVFRRKIIPLLQEYFYEDWAKVMLVLNDTAGGFIQADKWIPKGLSDGIDGLEARIRYQVNPNPFELQSYLNIYR
ncbi:AAA family ATPase [Burkholderia sp. BCC1988]|uniref:AAA family ATPase n=1 Tax=Burkholderia sp. BCC1988 TaxID=2817443 RepID=UPI002AAF2660|nr:AAA family ATPase [Burkholderia sp. BCC1988]